MAEQLAQIKDIVARLTAELSSITKVKLLKGATVCCSRPTVCYLLGRATPGVWVCLSVSRAASCRVCSKCLSAQWAVLTL